MKKYFRIISAILACAMLVTVLAACNSYSELELTNNVEPMAEGENNWDSYAYETKDVEFVDKSSIDASYVNAADGAQLEMPAAGDEIAVLETDMGNVLIRLFPEQCPITVNNFKSLVNAGYYDGMIFHRVINDFMIQGGDPTATGSGGGSIYGEEFENECERNLYNFRGALAMANTGADYTNSSQFFIVQTASCGATAADLQTAGWPTWAAEKYAELGGAFHLDGGLSPYGYAHTVFGQVFEGMKVVDEIAAVEVNAENSRPLKNVYIKKAYITTYAG